MQEIFSQNLTFEDLGLRECILKALRERNFERPTDIQARLIPCIINGRDVLGQARTGTGKTAAFGLPVLHRLENAKPISALILVPTRELAQQVTNEINGFATHNQVKATAIYGGEPIRAQVQRLERGPAIVVGTPGRVMDLHERRLLPYDNVQFAVLDEVDRMLDIGFRDDIRRILGGIKQPHQTIFVSATISDEIETLARRYMNDPEKIVTSAGSLTVQQVQQSHIIVQPWDKKRLLLHLLTHEEPALTVVFCAMKDTVDKVAEFLRQNKIDVHAIHGDMYQNKRNRVMKKFRSGQLGVLVASDLAARGLDVEGITHVINYDIPIDSEIYVHRIGRTARIGRDGTAWTFITPEEGKHLTAIEALINHEIPRVEYPDFEPGEVPEGVRRRIEAERERMEAARNKASRKYAESAPEADKTDASRFPGGLVPTSAPTRRLGGRLKSRRGR